MWNPCPGTASQVGCDEPVRASVVCAQTGPYGSHTFKLWFTFAPLGL